MKYFRVLGLGLLALAVLLVAGKMIRPRLTGRLQAVEVQAGNEIVRTEEPALLAEVEAWSCSVKGPSLWRLLQDWARPRTRCESSLRQADYCVTLVYDGGRREELYVWVWASGAVLVRRDGYECRAPGEPFTEMRKCRSAWK